MKIVRLLDMLNETGVNTAWLGEVYIEDEIGDPCEISPIMVEGLNRVGGVPVYLLRYQGPVDEVTIAPDTPVEEPRYEYRTLCNSRLTTLGLDVYETAEQARIEGHWDHKCGMAETGKHSLQRRLVTHWEDCGG